MLSFISENIELTTSGDIKISKYQNMMIYSLSFKTSKFFHCAFMESRCCCVAPFYVAILDSNEMLKCKTLLDLLFNG